MIDSEDRLTPPQPQRVGASRNPAVAVLLGALVTLVTFVFVLPRLTPPPAAPVDTPAAVAAAASPPSSPTPSPSPTPEATATPPATPAATPASTPIPPVPISVLGQWRFAPGERPNPSSTELEIEIFDNLCNSALTDPDQIQEPFIAYEETEVSISFPIFVLRGSYCGPNVSIPMTLKLAEPLDDRDLVDGGSGQLRFDGVGQFMVFTGDPESIAALASDHAAALVPDACVTSISGDVAYPSNRLVNRMSRSLAEPSGPIDNGRAFQGSWEQASRYFGAVEGYADDSGFSYQAILAPATRFGIDDPNGDRLALVQLTPFYPDTGYEVWYPAFLLAGFEAATVYAPPPCSS